MSELLDDEKIIIVFVFEDEDDDFEETLRR